MIKTKKVLRLTTFKNYCAQVKGIPILCLFKAIFPCSKVVVSFDVQNTVIYKLNQVVHCTSRKET